MQIEPLQVGTLFTNVAALALLIEMRVKLGLLWKDYLKRKRLNGD